jgi:hypothetical protein
VVDDKVPVELVVAARTVLELDTAPLLAESLSMYTTAVPLVQVTLSLRVPVAVAGVIDPS